MPAFIKNLTVDCDDALVVARFWAAALGSDVDEDSTPERAYVEAAAWGGPNIWFRGGRGPKLAGNRVHLDLRAPDQHGRGGRTAGRAGGVGGGAPRRHHRAAGPRGERVLRRAGPGRPAPAVGTLSGPGGG